MPQVGQMTPQAIREAAFLFDDNIIARPLSPAGVECVVTKNPNIYVKWINCSFNGGAMYEAAKAKGFVNVTPADVEVPGLVFKDGALRHSELILMKIDRNIAMGAIKASTMRALIQSGKSQDSLLNKQNLKQALTEVSRPQELKSKIQAFTPSPEVLKGLAG